jgi:hypothetical protein
MFRFAGRADGALGAGAVAQLGEHLLCKQGVVGSNPISSTSFPVEGSPVRVVNRPSVVTPRESWLFAL